MPARHPGQFGSPERPALGRRPGQRNRSFTITHRRLADAFDEVIQEKIGSGDLWSGYKRIAEHILSMVMGNKAEKRAPDVRWLDGFLKYWKGPPSLSEADVEMIEAGWDILDGRGSGAEQDGAATPADPKLQG